MKVNDIVEVFDGSYSIGIIDGEKRHVDGRELEGKKWKVVSFENHLPTESLFCVYTNPYENTFSNNVILQEVNKPENILFTQKRFCKVVQLKTDKKYPYAKIGYNSNGFYVFRSLKYFDIEFYQEKENWVKDCCSYYSRVLAEIIKDAYNSGIKEMNND